jgi:hypothetical protein
VQRLLDALPPEGSVPSVQFGQQIDNFFELIRRFAYSSKYYRLASSIIVFIRLFTN